MSAKIRTEGARLAADTSPIFLPSAYGGPGLVLPRTSVPRQDGPLGRCPRRGSEAVSPRHVGEDGAVRPRHVVSASDQSKKRSMTGTRELRVRFYESFDWAFQNFFDKMAELFMSPYFGRTRGYRPTWYTGRRRYRRGPRAIYPMGRYPRYYRRRAGRRRKKRKAVPKVRRVWQPTTLEKMVPKLTVEAREYIDTVTNPFGQTTGGVIKGIYHGAKIPDNSSYPTVPMSWHSNTTYNVTADGNGNRSKLVISTQPPNYDWNIGIMISGSIPSSNAPTNSKLAGFWEREATRDLFTRYRVVAVGMKVRFISSSDNTEGYMWGANSEGPITTNADPDYNSWDAIDSYLVKNTHPIRKGLTVRWIPRNEEDIQYYDFRAGPPSHYMDTDHFLPRIRLQALGALTEINVDVVWHIECQVLRNNIGIPATPSPVDLNWNLIFAMATNQELAPEVVEGDSFRSLFTRAGRFARSALQWMFKNAPKVASTALSLGAAAGALM